MRSCRSFSLAEKGSILRSQFPLEHLYPPFGSDGLSLRQDSADCFGTSPAVFRFQPAVARMPSTAVGCPAWTPLVEGQDQWIKSQTVEDLKKALAATELGQANANQPSPTAKNNI